MSATGLKQLAPARKAAKKASLRPGEQPRRRWMRYMRPSERNSHKLLYAVQPGLAPSQAMRPPKAASPRALRRDQVQLRDPLLAESDARAQQQPQHRGPYGPPGPGAHDPAHDPFAFSSPYGRHRNASSPAEAAAAQAASKAAAKAEAAARAAQGRTPTRFPLAEGTSRRTATPRPLGPLAHKQRVGPIFASSAAQPGESPSSAAAPRVYGRNGGLLRPSDNNFDHKGHSATSGAAKRREAIAKAAQEGKVIGRKLGPGNRRIPSKQRPAQQGQRK